MQQPHVQVVLGDSAVPPTLEAALRRTRASVSFRPITDALRPGSTMCADAVVVVAAQNDEMSDRIKLLFDRIADHPRGTLVLHDGERDPRWSRHPASLPVCFSNDPTEETLAVQLQTMLEMRHSLEALHRGTIANEASQQTSTQRYKDQLRLASRVQREFLPQELPRFGAISFSAIYRPAEYVSGDIYDIQRLDEEHVGIAVADATGEGIPAALLTVFIKRALRGKDIFDGKYRVLPPDEVLHRLNAEILDANLTECRFVAATYALLNIRTREVAIARGGSPYPILRRANGTTQLVRPFGGVVGILSEASFAVEKLQLNRGDSLVLYSDGVEHLIAPGAGLAGMAEVFTRAAAESRSAFESRVGVEPRGSEPRNAQGAPNSAASRKSSDAGAESRSTYESRIAADSRTAADPSRSTFEPRVPAGSRSASDSRASADSRSTTSPIAPSIEGANVPCARDARSAAGFDNTRSSGSDTPRSGRPSPDELIVTTSWFTTLRERGVPAAMSEFSARYNALRRIGQKMDDVTVLAIHVDE